MDKKKIEELDRRLDDPKFAMRLNEALANLPIGVRFDWRSWDPTPPKN